MESKRQLYVATGPFGVGKTTWAFEATLPADLEKVYWIDPEGSANNIKDQLKEMGKQFGRYVDFSERFKDKLPSGVDLLDAINKGNLPWADKQKGAALVEFYEYVLEDITKNLTPGKYQTFVFDPGEKLEAGMAAWAAANPNVVGVRENAGYGRFWSQGVYPLYESLFDAIWSRGVDLIILTFHLKTPWENGRPVMNKVVMSGKKILKPKSQLMVWLVNEPNNPRGAPAGLVLKERLGRLSIGDDGEWDTQRTIPRRIPECTWRQIRKYLRGDLPCDLANPAPGEVPSRDELEMISPLLTNKQMELMLLEAKKDLEETVQMRQGMASQEDPRPEGPIADAEVVKAILAARTEKSDDTIREELSKIYPLPVVVAAFMSLGS